MFLLVQRSEKLFGAPLMDEVMHIANRTFFSIAGFAHVIRTTTVCGLLKPWAAQKLQACFHKKSHDELPYLTPRLRNHGTA